AFAYPASSRPSSTLPSTVRQGNSANSWKTIAVAGRPAGSAPSKPTRPVVGVSSPASRFSKVDLPQPEGPTTATSSSASTAKVTPVSASTAWPERSRNVWPTPSTITLTRQRPSWPAQPEPLDLAGDRARQLCDELDDAGHLEAG